MPQPVDDDERRTQRTDERRTDERRTVELGGELGGEARAPASAAPLGRGTALDRYVVLEPLGEGGMGMVYAAYDTVLDRKVALKLLPPGDPETAGEANSGRARLLREAQAMARLSHPHVVAVYDVHQHGAQVFMAMELVEGRTLLQWQQQRARAWKEILAAFLDAGRGLAAAHDAGLVHRDFKPTNVLVGENGRVRVTDFGLARERHAPPDAPPAPPAPSRDTGPVKAHSLLELELTQHGAVLGTPAYMAPEQFLGAVADARSDQFSFAVSLWEALHGERPFEGSTPAERRQNVLDGRVRAPPSSSKVPPWVSRALLRALHREPAARYPAIHALLAVLGRDPAQVRRRRLTASALLLLVVGSGTLAAASWHERRELLCSGAPERLEGIWDERRQASISQAFLATGRAYAGDTWQRVRDALDTYTTAWKQMHVETCEATRLRGEQSEAVLSLRMACLDGRLQEVAALTEVFTEADGTVVEKAISATSALRGLRGCADVSALLSEVKPPEDPATRREVDASRARLARVKALTEAGKLQDALKLAADESQRTRDLGYRPVRAEALLLRAWTQNLAGEKQGVPELLTEALWLAHASRHDWIAASASVRLMGYYDDNGPPEEAARWEPFARAALDRLGENGELRAIYHNNRGLSLYAQGHFAEAHEAFDEAFALAERQLGPANAMTLRYGSNAVAALGNLDRLEESQRAYETLVRLGETNLGPFHPFLTQPLTNLANMYAFQGRLADARRLLDRVRIIGQQAYGERSEEWAQFHIAYGDLEAAEGHDAAALGHYEEAERQLRALTGADSLELLEALVKVADARAALERLELALRTYQQVLDVSQKDPERYERVHTQALGGLADLYDTRGEYARALGLRQQALELRERTLGKEHINTALMRVALGTSYLELGQGERALALFEREREVFEKTLGPDTAAGVLPLAGKGEALQKLGRAAEAIPVLEHVLDVVERHPLRPVYTASVRFALARSLWDARRQPERAWTLAQSARATYARAPLRHASELAELDRLFARHAGHAPDPLASPTPP